jgi:uncharacterized radical SAM protein YgiQ
LFVPVTLEEIEKLKWKYLDIIFVSGDIYIDTPYSGVSILSKLLIDKDFKVSIISQPSYKDNNYHKNHNEYIEFIDKFGKPKLFFGVTAGNFDSMVANYTASFRKRKNDDLTIGGKNLKRPDRATIVYSNLIRKYFKDVNIILGGIEASLRRVTHYDVWQDKIRKPILFDAKANYLIYGMAEISILIFSLLLNYNKDLDFISNYKKLKGINYIDKEIKNYKIIDFNEILKNDKKNIDYKKVNYLLNKRIFKERNKKHNFIDQKNFNENLLKNINHFNEYLEFIDDEEIYILLPSFEECIKDKNNFELFFKIFYQNNDPINSFSLIQKVGDRYLIHNRPQRNLKTSELDYLYELPYEYDLHPYYKKFGKVKALETIKNSITISRGCPGNCSFCSITVHQGKNLISRSKESILREIIRISEKKGFNGIIYDLGGATANLFNFYCDKINKFGSCKEKDCLFPEICENFKYDHKELLDLYNKIKENNKIKKIFIQSGLRYDLILHDKKYGELYLKEIIAEHIGGQIKIAPEHINEKVLKLMKKPDNLKFKNFINIFDKLKNELVKNVFLTFYIIAAFPGTTIKDQIELKKYFKKYLGLIPEQVQIFQPTPSTLATLIYYLEKDIFNDEKIFVEKKLKNKILQKNILFSNSINDGKLGNKINRKSK